VQRKQVWERTVLPTIAKYGRGVEDLAASMYTEIILRAALHAPAPDFSSLHAAVLHSAQQRVLTRRLSRMVNPKFFASADDASSSDAAAAAAAVAAADSAASDHHVHRSPRAFICGLSSLSNAESSFPPLISWADAVVPPEDAAAAAAAVAAAEAAAIASEKKSAADKQAAAEARIAAAAQAAIDAEIAREAEAAAAARAAAEAQRAHEQKLAQLAQAAADAKAAAEAKAIARAQAAAEAKSAAQAILAARAKAASEARAIAAAKYVLSTILTSAESKIAALSRAKALALSSPAAAAHPEVSERRFAQSRDSPLTPAAAEAHALPAAAFPSPLHSDSWQIEFDNAVAAMIVADDVTFTCVDADSSYFEGCLQQTAFSNNEDTAEDEDCSPELQAVMDEISRLM
jgi:hypothetical protein